MHAVRGKPRSSGHSALERQGNQFLASESELIRISAASGVTIGLADIANGFLTHEISFRDEEITEIYMEYKSHTSQGTRH
jgi:hypothetical protein